MNEREMTDYWSPVGSGTWRERIAEAEENGEFSDYDVMDASSFGTCAIAEQHTLHPEVVVYSPLLTHPLDNLLYDLGLRFDLAVQHHDIDRAGELLDEIEDRVLTLKRKKR